jgi:hypothetical protein
VGGFDCEHETHLRNCAGGPATPTLSPLRTQIEKPRVSDTGWWAVLVRGNSSCKLTRMSPLYSAVNRRTGEETTLGGWPYLSNKRRFAVTDSRDAGNCSPDYAVAVFSLPNDRPRLEWRYKPEGLEYYGVDAWNGENRVQLWALDANGKAGSHRSEADGAGLAAQAAERRIEPGRAGRDRLRPILEDRRHSPPTLSPRSRHPAVNAVSCAKRCVRGRVDRARCIRRSRPSWPPG